MLGIREVLSAALGQSGVTGSRTMQARSTYALAQYGIEVFVS